MPTYLTKQQIVTIKDLPEEDCEVPEWGGTVHLRGLTGAQRDRFEESSSTQSGADRILNVRNLRARLVSLCLVDMTTGQLMFPDPDDVKALGEKSAKSLSRVFNVCSRLSGFTREDVEEMSKVSSNSTDDASTSDLQASSAALLPNSSTESQAAS